MKKRVFMMFKEKYLKKLHFCVQLLKMVSPSVVIKGNKNGLFYLKQCEFYGYEEFNRNRKVFVRHS